MLTNAGFDQAKLKQQLAAAEREHRNAVLLEQWDRAAEIDASTGFDNQRVEVITARERALGRRDDGTTISGAGQYSLQPYKRAENVQRVRNAVRAKPKQYVVHDTDSVHVDGSVTPAGTLEKEFEDEFLEAIKLGIFCIRCEDRQPDNDNEHKRLLKRLQEHPLINYQLPAGLSELDVCCHCGGRLAARAGGR